jgi:hypothetical protein
MDMAMTGIRGGRAMATVDGGHFVWTALALIWVSGMERRRYIGVYSGDTPHELSSSYSLPIKVLTQADQGGVQDLHCREPTPEAVPQGF